MKNEFKTHNLYRGRVAVLERSIVPLLEHHKWVGENSKTQRASILKNATIFFAGTTFSFAFLLYRLRSSKSTSLFCKNLIYKIRIYLKNK